MIRIALILLCLAAPALRAQSGMDVKSHRLEISLGPAVKFVSGSVTTWFVPKAGNRDVISFDLSDSLQVLRVDYHGEVLASYVHQNGKLVVQLRRAPMGLRGEGRGPVFQRGDTAVGGDICVGQSFYIKCFAGELGTADEADGFGFEGYAYRYVGAGEHFAAMAGGGVGGEDEGLVFWHKCVEAVGCPGAFDGTG